MRYIRRNNLISCQWKHQIPKNILPGCQPCTKVELPTLALHLEKKVSRSDRNWLKRGLTWIKCRVCWWRGQGQRRWQRAIQREPIPAVGGLGLVVGGGNLVKWGIVGEKSLDIWKFRWTNLDHKRKAFYQIQTGRSLSGWHFLPRKSCQSSFCGKHLFHVIWNWKVS